MDSVIGKRVGINPSVAFSNNNDAFEELHSKLKSGKGEYGLPMKSVPLKPSVAIMSSCPKASSLWSTPFG